MNPKQTLLALASGGIVMSSALLTAQEQEIGSPPKRDGESAPTRERNPENEVPTPFIGVVTRELEAEVRAQTGIAEGFPGHESLSFRHRRVRGDACIATDTGGCPHRLLLPSSCRIDRSRLAPSCAVTSARAISTLLNMR